MLGFSHGWIRGYNLCRVIANAVRSTVVKTIHDFDGPFVLRSVSLHKVRLHEVLGWYASGVLEEWLGEWFAR